MSDDRIIGTLRAIVQSMFPNIDYLALYPAKVFAQNGDGSLELKPDDVRLPAVSQVPIRYGIPGVKVTVAPGARVLMGFAGGDPQQPVAELWEAATVTELKVSATAIEIGSDGVLQAAALGDAIRTELNAIWNAITQHKHPGVAVGAASTLVTTTVPVTQVTTSATVKVKA